MLTYSVIGKKNLNAKIEELKSNHFEIKRIIEQPAQVFIDIHLTTSYPDTMYTIEAEFMGFNKRRK